MIDRIKLSNKGLELYDQYDFWIYHIWLFKLLELK